MKKVNLLKKILSAGLVCSMAFSSLGSNFTFASSKSFPSTVEEYNRQHNSHINKKEFKKRKKQSKRARKANARLAAAKLPDNKEINTVESSNLTEEVTDSTTTNTPDKKAPNWFKTGVKVVSGLTAVAGAAYLVYTYPEQASAAYNATKSGLSKAYDYTSEKVLPYIKDKTSTAYNYTKETVLPVVGNKIADAYHYTKDTVLPSVGNKIADSYHYTKDTVLPVVGNKIADAYHYTKGTVFPSVGNKIADAYHYTKDTVLSAVGNKTGHVCHW